MGKWVRIDRRYNNPYRLTSHAHRTIVKWTALVIAWLVIISVLSAARLGILVVVVTAVLIWYAVRSARGGRPPKPRPVYPAPCDTSPAPPAALRFNPAPGWPLPPAEWSAPPGWQPDPAWPPAPPGWPLWIPDGAAPRPGAAGERNSRSIPQDVKIAVSHRDQGRCVECGSSQELHFDHKIPWSRGGANTVNNIQLLCGRCNRRKGATL
jgi:hypothetical protein